MVLQIGGNVSQSENKVRNMLGLTVCAILPFTTVAKNKRSVKMCCCFPIQRCWHWMRQQCSNAYSRRNGTYGTQNKEIRSIRSDSSLVSFSSVIFFFFHFKLHFACPQFKHSFLFCCCFSEKKSISDWKWNHFKHSLHLKFTFINGLWWDFFSLHLDMRTAHGCDFGFTHINCPTLQATRQQQFYFSSSYKIYCKCELNAWEPHRISTSFNVHGTGR